MMQKMIQNRDKAAVALFLGLVIGGPLLAEAVTGIFAVNNTSGQPTVVLDGSDGSVKFKKERKFTSGVNTIVEGSDGTDRQGMTEQGVSLFLNSGDAWGTFTSAAAGNDPTASISATFDNAEGDTVTPNAAPGYEILLVTTGMTATYGPVSGSNFTVGDKYASSFEIRNPAGLSPPIGGVWFKFRTTDISP